MTTLIKYPAGLPCLRLGSTQELVNPQLETKLQNGRSRVRRNFTATPVNFDATFSFTDEQAAVFSEFYRVDLKDGSEWFLMPVLEPLGLKERQVRVMGGYTYKLRGAPLSRQKTGRKWEYKMKMQMYLRPEFETEPLDPDCYVAVWRETKW